MAIPTSGRKTVTAAGTAEVLAAAVTPFEWLRVTALTGNTGLVSLGGSNTKAAAGATQNGAPLSAGQSLVLNARDDKVTDLNKMYVDAAVSGEGVAFMYSA